MSSELEGAQGHPFIGITFEMNKFSIFHGGGGRDKWSKTYQFGYSKKYNKWQLILVKDYCVDTHTMETTSDKKYTPPKDFGMINFEDFDPEKFLNEGIK